MDVMTPPLLQAKDMPGRNVCLGAHLEPNVMNYRCLSPLSWLDPANPLGPALRRACNPHHR